MRPVALLTGLAVFTASLSSFWNSSSGLYQLQRFFPPSRPMHTVAVLTVLAVLSHLGAVSGIPSAALADLAVSGFPLAVCINFSGSLSPHAHSSGFNGFSVFYRILEQFLESLQQL